jgi:glycosyltransferase involved in cell wall biosynthesis
MLLELFLASFSLLVLLGTILVLGYLALTENAAPRFIDSVRELKTKRGSDLLVSVIVPARNEEQTIAACLESIIHQSHTKIEILVVDDSSTDHTRDVVSRFLEIDSRIRLVEAGKRPEGWVGKSWPCSKGFENSGGEYLLFIDADSTLESSALESSLSYALERKIDMFSLSPRVEMPSLAARAVLPMVSGAINLLYPMQRVNDKESSRAYVFGTFVLVERRVYEAIGGHERVKSEIVEDAAIARAAKASGHFLRIERGPEFIKTKWESSARDIYNGLERIISSSVRGYGLVSIVNAILLFFITLYPIFYVAIYIAARQTNPVLYVGFIGCLLSILAFLALALYEARTVTGRVGVSGLLYPLGAVFFISAIVTTSIKVARRREIRWKEFGYVEANA